MNKAGAITLSSICFTLAIVLFWLSGVSSRLIFEPVTTLMGITGGSITINIIFVFSFFIILSFGYAALAASVIENKKDNILMLSIIPPLIVALGIYRTNILCFFFLLGFVLSVAVFINRVNSEKEAYRKIRPYHISNTSVKSAFLMVSLMMAVGVLSVMIVYPETPERVVKDSFSLLVSMPTGMGGQLAETQVEMMYEMLESTESSLITAASIYMSPQCVSELNNAIDEMDKYAREKIRESVSANAQQSVGEDKIMEMLQKSEFYPMIYKLLLVSLPLAVFAILELFKVLVLAPFVGVFTKVLVRNIPEEE